MPDAISPTLALPALIAALVFGYLLGSIPFGLLLTRIAGLGDVRAIGSGNIGATNVLRTGHKGLAGATLAADVLKGTLAVLIARYFGGMEAGATAGVGAFLGHLFPVWLGFKGGKGVATYIGILLGLAWLAALQFCAIWLIVALVFRYSSLSALAASAFTPTFFIMTGQPGLAALFLALSVLLWIMHRQNIVRLLTGKEPRIGKSKGSDG
jgi:glycerol-3-phosphate acyltransferase PlsY